MDFLEPGTSLELAAAYGDDLDAVIDRVADYMARAPVVLSTPALISDPQSGKPHLVGYHCDGEWIWTDSAAGAVRTRRIAVPLQFAEKVMAVGGPPVSLAPADVEAAFETISHSA